MQKLTLSSWPKIFLLFFFVTTAFIYPQVQKANYKILGINVTGNKSADASTIIANSGLKVGDEIDIPGDQTNNAVRRLWNLGIFEDVQILIDKKIDNGIFLQLVVKEYPRLEKFVLEGNDELSQSEIDKILTIVRGQTLKPQEVTRIKNKFLDKYA